MKRTFRFALPTTALARSFLSATIPAGALIAGWPAKPTAQKASFQRRGNHRVRIEDDGSATAQRGNTVVRNTPGS